MRIISQDGMNDIPYDECVLVMRKINEKPLVIEKEYRFMIEAFTYSLCKVMIGEYSTKQKAAAVMKEIRDLSADPDVIYYELPKDEDVDWLEKEECDG